MTDTFDQTYGTDTAGSQAIPFARRLFTRAGWHAVHYGTVREDKIRALLEPWPRTATVVDLGCGKGRTLVIAGLMGFSVYGVEFQATLADTARHNLARVGVAGHIVTGDAATAPLPDGPLVIYLYNPFRGPLMQTVAQRLRTHGDAIVIYVNPYCADAFADWTPIALTPAQSALFSPGSVLLCAHGFPGTPRCRPRA